MSLKIFECFVRLTTKSDIVMGLEIERSGSSRLKESVLNRAFLNLPVPFWGWDRWPSRDGFR
jgi:hypothetical protein